LRGDPLQLLPTLPTEARARFAEAAFRHPEELDLGVGAVEVIGPGVGQTGTPAGSSTPSNPV
jgi:hypothetical protein